MSIMVEVKRCWTEERRTGRELWLGTGRCITITRYGTHIYAASIAGLVKYTGQYSQKFRLS